MLGAEYAKKSVTWPLGLWEIVVNELAKIVSSKVLFSAMRMIGI